MGFRFRKSFKIAPGVKVNIGKKSVGMSIGGKRGGISFNSKSGTRARASIPGTGISYSTKLGGGKRKSGRKKSTKKGSNFSTHANTGNYTPVCLRWWYIALIVVFAIGGFGNLGTNNGAAIFGIVVAAIMGFFSLWVIIWGIKGSISHSEKNQPEINIDKLEQAEDLGTMATILSENDLISVPQDEYHNTFGDDLHHLTPDGELPFGWVRYYQDFTSQQEKKIDNKWKAVYSAASTQEKLDAFRRYFDTVTKVGEVCRNTGECHYKWFCENIIESQWYNDQLEQYKRLKQESPDLLKREKLLTNLEADIMTRLHECNGILQSDFIKTFDPLIKTEVSSFLYEADKAGKIKRTKSGRSYTLEIKA